MKGKKINIIVTITAFFVFLIIVTSISTILAVSKNEKSNDKEEYSEGKMTNKKELIISTDKIIAQKEDEKERLNNAIEEVKYRLCCSLSQ